MKYKKGDVKEPNDSVLFPPVEDAFLKTPVASGRDCTGYAVTIPLSDEEAESYESLFRVPCTAAPKVKNEMTSVEKMEENKRK